MKSIGPFGKFLAGSVFLAMLLPSSPAICGSASGSDAKLPPWSDRDPQQFDFTVYGVDSIPDLHGSPSGADLVIFAAGNQFMVMPALVSAFRARHPEVRRVFYETLPPGVEAKQIERGSIEFGNLIVDAKPDVLLAGIRRMQQERASGVISSFVPYASNQLAIEVAAGNPKGIRGLSDLGRADVRVSMPNPVWEGVAMQIEAAYRRAGGDALIATIMHAKVAAGTTLLTHIHHRETPIYIMTGKADAGPVWISEALYQRRIGNPIDIVSIPQAENVTGIYAAATIDAAPHPAVAKAFVDFIHSVPAAAIYRDYGFAPPPEPASLTRQPPPSSP